MSRNDANDYAQRLYARVPAYYRVLDEEQGMPLYALLATVGEQVANIRADLDALWDDFFIETCEDWVVPYLASLTGTHLLANPVGVGRSMFDVRFSNSTPTRPGVENVDVEIGDAETLAAKYPDVADDPRAFQRG